MFDSTIANFDAGAASGVAVSRALLAFARDLTRYAAGGAECDARRALGSPFSGVPLVDARALGVIAGERGRICKAIERERVALAPAGAVAAHAFARALAAIADSYRAQGATAREHLDTIATGFDFSGRLDSTERATWDALVARAERSDAERTAGVAWHPREVLAAIDACARSASPPPAVARERPLAMREPESPRNVRRRRGHFSASSLGTYAECERRWYYRYVCAAVEDRGSSASFYGTAFHWALERFHEEFRRADDGPAELLERKLDAYLGTAFERFRSGFETAVEYELQRRRARRTGRRYLAWFLDRSRREPFTVIGTETAVELELDGYQFIGYVDRLDRNDATAAVTVVDYKTGSIAESAREYREAVAQFVDFQLPFYYWARTAAGDRVTRLSLVPLKEASLEVRPVELEVVPIAALPSYSDAAVGTIGIDELERARVKMIALAATLADAPLVRFPVTDDPEACTYCSYRIACRERPLVREERFGR